MTRSQELAFSKRVQRVACAFADKFYFILFKDLQQQKDHRAFFFFLNRRTSAFIPMICSHLLIKHVLRKQVPLRENKEQNERIGLHDRKY